MPVGRPRGRRAPAVGNPSGSGASAQPSKRSPGVIRTPRAQSGAAITFLPWGRTSRSSTGVDPVPRSTERLVTCSSPGASVREGASTESADGIRAAAVASPTGPSLTRSPRKVVQAPGAGVHPRTCRSTTWAGHPHRTCASSVVSLGAWLTPSSGWGTAWSDPSAMPSIVATSRPAPAWARRSSRMPLVSLGRTVSVRVPSSGPVSSPSSSRNVVAPVTSSPAMIARCTGAAPRQAGSSEKCRLTQPTRGTSSAARGTRAP